MENCPNTCHCAMMEKGGKCCEGIANHKCGPGAFVFGAAVIAGLIVIIVLQSKTLEALKKIASKKK